MMLSPEERSRFVNDVDARIESLRRRMNSAQSTLAVRNEVETLLDSLTYDAERDNSSANRLLDEGWRKTGSLEFHGRLIPQNGPERPLEQELLCDLIESMIRMVTHGTTDVIRRQMLAVVRDRADAYLSVRGVSETGGVNCASVPNDFPDFRTQDITQLRNDLESALDEEQWAKQTQLKRHGEPIAVQSLNSQRARGRKTGDGCFGVDPSGRVWRKDNKESKVVHYYLPSLLSSRTANRA